MYWVKFKIADEKDQEQFKNAFSDILLLSKKLLASKNKKVKKFVSDRVDEDWRWLWVNDESIGIQSELLVKINKSDADKFSRITYNFGKLYPAQPEYLTAIMLIICAYFPNAVISDELWGEEDEFKDGACLASLVNPKANHNTLSDETYDKLEPSEDMRAILKALR